MTPLKLVGGFGSPYSRKMRAVLRFRRIPFTWIMRGSAADVGIPAVPVALIPVLVFPGNAGRAEDAMIDSTFQIRRLEKTFPSHSIIPPDPALAFLDALLEDYADEWLTKPMFHYRWKYAADIHKASHVLALDRDPLMRGLGYGAEYQYPHDYAGGLSDQSHLPDKLAGKIYYTPTDRGDEGRIREYLAAAHKLRAAAKREK